MEENIENQNLSDYVVETRNLCKKYGPQMAVDNVNMHIKKGSIYGFVGENGSGKTTIIRLLMGLANPTGGSYSLYGVENNKREIYKIRNKISAIVEAPSLVPSMTAKQNLMYACLYYGIKDADKVIEESLHNVGLGDTGNKKVKNFSLGMRQRLGIAVLLLNKPDLMLLDEPMNGLDPSGVAELRDLIISLNQKGITFLISSHILSELEKVATHWGFLSHGKLLEEITATELSEKNRSYIEVKYSNIPLLEQGLKNIGIKNYRVTPVSIQVSDKVTPIEIITKLAQIGVAVSDIQTVDTNVEQYYLSLIGGKE